MRSLLLRNFCKEAVEDKIATAELIVDFKQLTLCGRLPKLSLRRPEP
jgi:hypothetical protein